MYSSDNQPLFRDVPVALWLFGLIFFGVGVGVGFFNRAPLWFGLIFAVIGLSFLLFVPIITVTVDRNTGLLLIRRTGIFRSSVEEVQVRQIRDVYVSRKVSTSSDGTSTTYQVRIVLEDGQEIPIRKYTSSGFRGKDKQARLIREALDIPEGGFRAEARNANLRWAGQEAVRQVYEEEQIEKTNEIGKPQVTDGVEWELQTITYGTTPLSRWVSPSYSTNGFFLYIAQKVEGQKDQKMLMNMLGKTLFKQSLKMFGFDASYTPGVDQAEIMEGLDKRLLAEYFVYTSSPTETHRLLNPWVVAPLLGWADRHPVQSGSSEYNQLTVLFSPRGVYLSTLGILNQTHLDELVGLGVEIVRAQGV